MSSLEELFKDRYTDLDPDYAATRIDQHGPPPPTWESVQNPQQQRPGNDSWSISAPVQPPSQPSVGGIGKKLLESAGWKEGSGLGRTGQGIVDPIALAARGDRVGLGHEEIPKPYESKTHTTDTDRFVDQVQEVTFLSCKEPYEGDGIILKDITTEENPAVDYNLFCTQEAVDKLFAAKSRFDGIQERDFDSARSRANPYEKIGKSIFINRAAVKMAELDHLYHLRDVGKPPGTFYFGDICAGPGGFTEYLLWRLQTGGRGWGMTLRGDNDWKLHNFNSQSPISQFETTYGVDNTGDIYNSDNMRVYRSFVERGTQGEFLDLLTADGGFSVAGDENFQEEILQQLVLCQFLTGLLTLKKGGSFVCKVFDLFTPFTVGLIYIFYRHFREISIVKPFTSRPANSERYIVAKGLLEQNPKVIEHLFRVNQVVNDLKEENKSNKVEKKVVHLVPLERMTSDAEFMAYIRAQNLKQATSQVEALTDIYKYLEDQELGSVDQLDIRKRCLMEWKLPLDRGAVTHNSRRGRGGYHQSPHQHGAPKGSWAPQSTPASGYAPTSFAPQGYNPQIANSAPSAPKPAPPKAAKVYSSSSLSIFNEEPARKKAKRE